MPTIQITESDMTFGPFDARNVFHIEKCRFIQNDTPFKIAEFILITNNNKLTIVEAKKSSPRPNNQENFESFLAEISAKLSNTFHFWLSLRLNRHPAYFNELPAKFQSVDISTAKFQLILVINEHKEEWLPPIKDALNQKMKAFSKIWNFTPNPVMVINHEWARQWNMIQ